jgi:hypothetical protein
MDTTRQTAVPQEVDMTDPDLVFDMDPRNVQRVEEWIAERWPGAMGGKDADGSRLTWSLGGQAGAIESVVATESFLSLAPAELEQMLVEAVRVCELQPEGATCYLLLAVDGARTVTD